MQFIMWTGHLVTKATAQTITGEKNLKQGVKFTFGDGDTYLIEGADDQLWFYVADTLTFQFISSGLILGSNTNYAYVKNSISSNSNPVFVPTFADSDTGIGRNGDDQLSLIAGGSEGIRVDASSTAGNTRMRVYDVDNSTIARVSVGADDSGGAGFKVLRIPN